MGNADLAQDHGGLTGLTLGGKRVRVSDIRLGRFMLGNSSHEIRLSGLSLLTSSPSTTQPFTKGTLTCLQAYLPHMYADTDAGFRSEVLSLTMGIVDRLRGSSSQMGRENLATNHHPQNTSQEKSQSRYVFTREKHWNPPCLQKVKESQSFCRRTQASCLGFGTFLFLNSALQPRIKGISWLYERSLSFPDRE